MQQADEIRLKEHPGLQHVPIQLLGGAVDNLLPVCGGAAVEKIAERLHDIHHRPGKGGGEGIRPPVILIKRLPDIADAGITGHQRRDERNVLKQHALILVFLPDAAAKQLVDAVGDVVAIGNVVRQVDLPARIGGDHRAAVFLHIQDLHIAHNDVVLLLPGFCIHFLVHIRQHGVIRIDESDVLSRVACEAQPLVLLVDHPDKPGIFPRIAVTDLRARVLAAVVNQDDLLFLKGLREHRVHRPLQIVLHLINRYNHRYLNRFHHGNHHPLPDSRERP